MNEENKSLWTPKEVRKTLNFIVGIFLIIAGVWLIVKDVKAEGNFDFKSEIISGKLQSSSVGLFIVLFGILYLLLTNLSGISDYLKLIKNNKVIALIAVLVLLVFGSIVSFIFNTTVPLMFLVGATLPTFILLIKSLGNNE
ncbi:hypothetical protein [Pedobacter sp.]